MQASESSHSGATFDSISVLSKASVIIGNWNPSFCNLLYTWFTYPSLGFVLNMMDHDWISCNKYSLTVWFRFLSFNVRTMASINSLEEISDKKCSPPFLIQKSISFRDDFCRFGFLLLMNRFLSPRIASFDGTCFDRIKSLISSAAEKSMSPLGIDSEVASAIFSSIEVAVPDRPNHDISVCCV
ncbi:hypothetical protein OGAPHI_005897 [Ogataea philodendri]|uniref:Uncharacterized protein n=1 Tax=Ogataea philodendri TaxID=1378263 RepID=A0A9P8NYD5_9ASCO|nr:uncharacterized protein OGAPHI_005897 [Ogataea philodendri]KAH3661719.1 hypothetical protein OGAPHI_005897 [Ogataea philodendri]